MADITIKDIASKLGISPATVSMALNDRAGVNARTKERVLELVKELNYKRSTPPKKASASQGVLSFFVYRRHGQVLADTQFFADLIEAVEQAARLEKYTVALTYCMGRETLAESLAAALSVSPAGMLLLATELEEGDLAAFSRLGIPLVLLDADLCATPFDTVTIHNEDGIVRAVEYLRGKGHKEIGFLKSSIPIKNFEQRFAAFQGLEPEGKVYLLEPSVEGARLDICELIREGVEFPSALIADNDLIAIGAMKGFLQNALRVPEGISVVGFDDIPMALYFEPALTTVRVSREELGTAAVHQLLWRMEHEDASPHRLSVGTKLIERASVKDLRSVPVD